MGPRPIGTALAPAQLHDAWPAAVSPLPPASCGCSRRGRRIKAVLASLESSVDANDLSSWLPTGYLPLPKKQRCPSSVGVARLPCNAMGTRAPLPTGRGPAPARASTWSRSCRHRVRRRCSSPSTTGMCRS